MVLYKKKDIRFVSILIEELIHNACDIYINISLVTMKLVVCIGVIQLFAELMVR